MSSGLPQMPPLAQGSMGSSKSAQKKAEIQRDRAAPGTKSKSGFQVEYRSDGNYYSTFLFCICILCRGANFNFILFLYHTTVYWVCVCFF